MRLLGPLGWHGVAMMEFKQDRRTGRAFLMEVNGRFWGSLDLAVQAGVDFPYLSHQLALGEPIETPQTYQVGVRSRWLLGDLDHLLLRLFHRNNGQHLPDGMPSRARALLDFMQLAGAGLHYDVISRDDPRPFVSTRLHQYARHCPRRRRPAVGRRLHPCRSHHVCARRRHCPPRSEPQRGSHVGALRKAGTPAPNPDLPRDDRGLVGRRRGAARDDRAVPG